MGPPKSFIPAVLDPFVFHDGDALYMLYVGGSEFGGIGISRLEPSPAVRNCGERRPLHKRARSNADGAVSAAAIPGVTREFPIEQRGLPL